jgi:DNA-binding transcriptional LysR family regulator
MHRFSLRQLEYFVACVDHGSTADAASALNVSQPTISIAVTKLEDQLGVQLLRRHHSQGVTATASSENILHSARAL